MNLSDARSGRRGQTTVEATVVITGLIFLTFSIMNLGFLLHSKMVATYAAFMAGRSFQVLGDQTGAEFYQENASKEDGGIPQNFLNEMKDSKYPGFFRVAEDIFTCALPWMAAPAGDRLQNITDTDREKTIDERCAAGKRKYETFNVGTPVFIPWDPAGSKSSFFDQTSGLEKVNESFTEVGRDPLRYGVLRITYRTPLIFPMPELQYVDSRDRPRNTAEFHTGEVFVPVLLNPGLRIELKKAEGGDAEKDFENSAFKEK